MQLLGHLVRLALLLAAFAAGTVQAQLSCGPTGFNAIGQPCGAAAGGAAGSAGQYGADGAAGAAGWSDSSTVPSITNRGLGGQGAGAAQQRGQAQGDPRFRDQRIQRSQQFPSDFDPQQQDDMQQFRRLRTPHERNDFQDLVLQSVGRDLPMFGYNLFYGVPTTFAPLDGVPVTPDYVLGPGDELLIRGWGAVDIDYRAVVDRNGTINIPRVGTINVSGMRARDMQPYLKSQIGRVFRNFELNVALGQLRSIQIFVVGHAVRPGAYTVSSLSTLVNALFASGGPSVKGSMRRVQLKRGDKLVTEFDLYDLLAKGDKSKDVQLLPGDVIHIPPIGALAAVSGSVNKPAIYEVKDEKTIGELLQLAGGLTTTADGQKVTVERIVGRRARQVEEFTIDPAGLAHAVRDGDLVSVLQLSPRFDNTVTVRGNIAVPARHPYRAGMRVRDVVPDRDSLIVPDYWVKRNIAIRPDVTGRESYGFRHELAQELRNGTSGHSRRGESGNNLQDSQNMWPGQSGMQGQQGLLGSIQGSQGFQGMPVQQGQPLMQNGPGMQGLQRNQVMMGNADRSAARRTPTVRNEIQQQLPEVNWDYAVIERLKRDDLTTQLIPFNLGKAIIDGDPQNNLALQPGDVVTVFSKDDIQVPVAKQTKFVRLEGELATPGVYQVLAGETLRQLVTRVGGVSRNAYVYGAEFTRESVRMEQQKRLEDSLDRFAQEIERNATLQGQRALDPADAGRAQMQAESNRRLLDRMRNVQASGRVVLDLQPGAQLKDLPDIALEDGDRFVIPSRPSTVGVIGAVFNQNTFVYGGGKSLSEYLHQAGGTTRSADTARIYVLRADGAVVSKAQGSIFRLSGDTTVQPGDTIVVPENLDRFQLTRELKDWSQIFYQFALGVAGLKVLQDL